MPYLALRTNKTLTLSQEVELKTTVGKLITMFPGESVDTFMIHIEYNQYDDHIILKRSLYRWTEGTVCSWTY